MNRLKLMSLTAAVAFCVAPLAWAMGPSDRDDQNLGRVAAGSQDRLPIVCTGEKIDGSTVDTARAKLESAGFERVHGLKKGCDNFWHGMASKDGRESGVVLTAQGQVLSDGD